MAVESELSMKANIGEEAKVNEKGRDGGHGVFKVEFG